MGRCDKVILGVTSLMLCMLWGCGTELTTGADESDQKPVILARDLAPQQSVAPQSYIVAFRNDLAFAGMNFSDFRSEYQAHILPLQNQMGTESGVVDMQYLAAVDLAHTQSLPWYQSLLSSPALQLNWDENKLPAQAASIVDVKFADEPSAERLLQQWHDQGAIWFAEPNYENKLFDAFSDYATKYQDVIGTGTDKTAPWLDQINLLQAYQALSSAGANTAERPLIAVMDSGIDFEHPALVKNVWENTSLNQSGCTNDLHGCNTTKAARGILGNGDVFPVGTNGAGVDCPTGTGATCRHGTHVAGLIAAEPQEDYGGVCPYCQVMAVKIVGRTARGEGSENSIMDSSIIAGFSYISRFKRSGAAAIRVVNASFGKFQRSRTVELLIRLLRSSKGIVVIAAAGNEDTMQRQYPAAFGDVISVGNVQSDTGVKNRTSNFGRWVRVSAPGGGPCDLFGPDGIRSSVPGGSSYCSEGSSMSAPIVSGIAGLLLTLKPDMSYDELNDRLVRTADPGIYDVDGNQAYNPKIRQEQFPVPLLGTGVVNAFNAVSFTIPSNPKRVASVDRVNNACGSLGLATQSSGLWSLLLALPVFWVFRRRKS